MNSPLRSDRPENERAKCILTGERKKHDRGKYPLRQNRVQQSTAAPGIVFAILMAVSAAVSFDELGITVFPADETEAARMLEDGSLDSSLWNAIREFYAAPISVPRGECAILQDLFFFLPDDLPVTESALAAYEPWGRKEQERFFERYPELEPFLPVLSFESHSSGAFPVRTAFYFSKQNIDDTSRQYAVFSLGDKRNLSASGRIDFSNEYGRWRRRTLEYRPLTKVRITAGNFYAPRWTSLLYGYFPATGESDSSVAGNWLHARSRTWNGVQVRFSDSRIGSKMRLSGEAFLHDRPTERIALAQGSLSPVNRLTCFGGVSCLIMDGDIERDRLYYLHAGCNVDLGGEWNGQLFAGMNAGATDFSIPWNIEINNRVKKNCFRGSIGHLPAGFRAPRSRLYMMAEGKGLFEDSLHQDALFADLTWSHQWSSFFTVVSELNTLFADRNLYFAHPSIGIAGSLPLSYRLRYSWLPIERSEEVEHERQQIVFSVSMPVGSRVVFDGTHTTRAGVDGWWRNRSMITPTIRISRALYLAPVYIVTGSAGDRWEHVAGLKQRLSLHDKTYTEFTLERELPFTSWESIRAQARMSFLF
jgi:hypothetical protein